MLTSTPLTSLTLALLHAVGGARTLHALAQTLLVSADSLHPVLESLIQQGWVCVTSQDAQRYSLTPQGGEASPVPFTENTSCAQVLQAHRQGRAFMACELLVDHMNTLLNRSRAAGAVLCLEWALALLEQGKQEFLQDIRRFVQLTLNLADISMYLTKFHHETRTLCQYARGVAQREGDLRNTVLLQLVEACLENMAAECTPARAQEMHKECEQALQSLNDSDMLSRAHYFMGMFYFWQGRFQLVLQSFEEAQVRPQLWQCRFQTQMFSLYTSSAALYLGRTHQAVGILESARRSAVLAQDSFKTMWWEAQLAVVMLYMGRDEEALVLLDHVISTANAESETKILHWGMRGLAFYHYRQGNIFASHKLMQEAMQVARKNGMRRPIYSYPWMFEMLRAYEQAGLASIEGMHLDKELLRAMEGSNVHLRAAALRTQALRTQDVPAAQLLLRQSLHSFMEVGNMLEVQSTEAMLHGLPSSASEIPLGQGESIENQCRLALHSIHALTEFHQFINQMTYIASCEMGAERAALLRVDADDTLHVAASCNMSEAELKTGHLVSHVSRMQTALQGSPLLFEDKKRVSLILPLRLDVENRWILYLESNYAVHTLQSIGMASQEALAHLFTEDLRTAVRIQREQSALPIENQDIARVVPYQDNPQALLHGSPVTRRVLSHARQLSATNAPVLILGETGVGKELLARYIHDCSGRTGAFVPVHPASIPDGLFESEFFGHEKGSFTGAHKRKIGLAELADKGTLFIDEVGDIPAPMQVKLLRVFQDQRFLRVGGNFEICSEFRLVGATNKDLWQEVQEGRFREDLYYRMSVVPLTLPPLRERREDIQVLVQLFLDRYSRRYHRVIPAPSREDMAALLHYAWPGNVRELKSVVERAVILHRDGPMEFALPAYNEKPTAPREDNGHPAQPLLAEKTSQDIIADWPDVNTLLARYIRKVLALTNGRVTGPRGALKILQMKRSTLYARMKQYGIQ